MNTELSIPVNQAVEALEEKLLKLPQVYLPLKHHFAPGVYVREMFMPKGAFIVGAEHKTEHLNIALTGKARVLVDGEVKVVEAPMILLSGAGTRKVGYVLEDMRWLSVHATEETDLEKLEEALIVVTQNYLNCKEQMAILGSRQ